MSDSNDQLRFLSQTAFIEEATTPYLLRLTLWSIIGAVFLFILWSIFANVKEIVKTQGKVIPTGHVQAIQHLEGGVIEKLYVHDGKLVKKDDLLIKLDSTNIQGELERLEVKQFALKIRAERLASLAEGREANFSKVSDQHPNLIQKQKEIIESFKEAQNEEAAIINKQLDQKIEARNGLLQIKETLKKNVLIATENYELERRAFEAGIGLKTSYLNAKSNWINQKGEFERISGQIKSSEDQIIEFESRLRSLDLTSKDKVQHELGEVENQIAESEKVLMNLREKFRKLEIRAPVSGIVKGLEVNTIGAVIPPGRKIMEIVPTDEELIAEIKIPPQDVGHVKIGDTVTIKVTSYDFSRYGTIKGNLESVSASTFTGEKGETFYKARVKLEQNYVGDNPKQNYILPGMEVLGDIITGDKTVMQFLLKPIHVSLSGAFSER